MPHLLIADEVHNLGAPNLKSKLDPQIRYRLGLSATPERQGDEEGTQALFDYFGDVVYEFPIKEAIERDVLCRYFYYPVLVNLTEKETDEYWKLTIEIGRAMARENGEEMSIRLKHLLIQRSRLIGSASEKMTALKKVILDLDQPLKKALVYCGDGRVDMVTMRRNQPDKLWLPAASSVTSVVSKCGNSRVMRLRTSVKKS